MLTFDAPETFQALTCNLGDFDLSSIMSTKDSPSADFATQDVENWDEDGDLDFSSVVSGEALMSTSSNRLSIDSIADVIEPSIEIPPFDGIHSMRHHEGDYRGFGDRDMDGEEDEDEEQGDTLKVSDLTSETLAQLAAFAKKKKEPQNQIGKDYENVQSNQQYTSYLTQDQPISMHTYLQNAQDDWDEDLEIPESFSMQSLKIRHSSSASENDFETPSLASTSDVTSLSVSSDHQSNFHQAKPTSILSKSDSNLKEQKNLEGGEEDFALSSQLRTLHLHTGLGRRMGGVLSERARTVSLQSEEDWGSPASSKVSRHVANLSIEGSIHSELSGDRVEEDFDDLDFDSFQNVESEPASGKGAKPTNLAEQLRARLKARNTNFSPYKTSSSVDLGSDKSTPVNAEADLTSGLVITDDMDLSPSRLKARNLSSKLREAAHLRRKRQDGKPVQSATNEGKGKQKGQTQHVAPPPLPWGQRKSNLPSEGLPTSSGSTMSYVGQWTDGIANRFSNSRPSTPSKAEPVSGRVSTWRAGSMGYTMPTAASLARSSMNFQDSSSQSGSITSARGPKVLRKPRKPRKYGDGKELDDIDDLPMSRWQNTKAGAVNASDPKISQGKQRKKKQPVLIRNLGGASTSTKMVGEMRWNPVLKKWEGNEQEGREFENAIRGTGRPALITQLSFAPLIGGSDVPISSPPRSIPSSSTPSIRSPPATASTLRVVGDMAFDPVRLCWVRQDGQEEADPFESMADESMSDIEAADSDQDEDLHVRKLRQRTASAEVLRIIEQDDTNISIVAGAGAERPSIDEASSYKLIFDLIRSSRTSQKAKEIRIPNELKDLIPESVWSTTIAAQQRHDREMLGFQKRERVPASKAAHKALDHRNRQAMGPLYLIQTLARRTPGGS